MAAAGSGLAGTRGCRRSDSRRPDQVWPEVQGAWYPQQAIREHSDRRDGLDCALGRRRSTFCDRIPGREGMRHQLLDTVVLNRDLPKHGLCRGDLGAVVELYEPDGLEVEFVRAS